ncbi:LLM class flavin-dependent oxidoreductase [Prauserella endophytica]|uniref:LLM class flavin-dependent oxidoreductase n=1 Tax=Prauserella endophytica TaxID=1592324 RepID=A0ABY2S9S5_9PSEU|nr:LLM class flavin-dependent oxidoreductase [Prauserella endophytica]TKG72634.1 LLM class flavin-dependent oxidoreductase [Prauserella endophytica]
MRIGVTLDLATVSLADVPALAAAVEEAALDLVWLAAPSGRPEVALAAAATCAEPTRTVLIGAGTAVAEHHPLYLAEERHVADQLLGGRLVLGLRGDDEASLTEWADVLLAAAGTTPFAHRGPRHTIPAGLPQHTVNPETRVRVTPAPYALEPTLWLLGRAAPAVASAYALSPVSEEDGAPVWRHLERSLGPACRRLRRPAVRTWDPGAEDVVELARRLSAERDGWGLDTTLLRLTPPPGTAAWHAALADLAVVVRPRLQQERLPAGLEELWDAERTHQHTAGVEREVIT